jgi:hypothetical protein
MIGLRDILLSSVFCLASCAAAIAGGSSGPPGTGVLASSPLFNPAIIPAALYLPAGYAFGTLTSGNPTTFAAIGMTLAAAQAQYGSGLVTATSQYVDDVVVQFTLNRAQTLFATQGKTCVVLPSSNEYWDKQVTYNAGQVCLIGSGNTGAGVGTVIYTQAVGAGTAALRVTGSFLADSTVLNDVAFVAFNSGALGMPGAQGGVAAAGGVPSGMTVPSGFYYYTGAIALAIDNASSGVMSNVEFYNYDTPMTYLTGNVYIWYFRNFTYQWNNHGINIEAALSNSFEGMHWVGGVSSNNNRNVALSPGTQGGSLFIDHMSLDYPNEYQAVLDFNGTAANDLRMSLTISNSHIETDSTHTGTANCRIWNAGMLFMVGNMGDEEGSFPVGWVCPQFYGREGLTNNIIPGQGPGGAYMPAVYTPSAIQWAPTGTGNMQRYGGDVLLYRSPDGDLMGGPTIYPSGANATGSFTLALAHQLPIIYLSAVGGTGTITVPPASTTHFANGVPILFETIDSSVWTVSCAGPPACSGTLTGIGGAPGVKFTLTPTATDVWQK